MKSKRKRHANEFLRTSTGRLAGNGMPTDDYSENSFPGEGEQPLDRSSFIFMGYPIGKTEVEERHKTMQDESPVITYNLNDLKEDDE